MKREAFIHKDLASITGVRESTSLHLSIATSDGETEIVLKHTVSRRLPLNSDNYEKSLKDYESLTQSSGGRLVIDMDHLLEFLKTGKIV